MTLCVCKSFRLLKIIHFITALGNSFFKNVFSVIISKCNKVISGILWTLVESNLQKIKYTWKSFPFSG